MDVRFLFGVSLFSSSSSRSNASYTRSRCLSPAKCLETDWCLDFLYCEMNGESKKTTTQTIRKAEIEVSTFLSTTMAGIRY